MDGDEPPAEISDPQPDAPPLRPEIPQNPLEGVEDGPGGHPELTPKQSRAIAALMTEQSILRASEVAGVAERTLHVWLALPHFAAEYRRVRREAFRQAVSLSQRYATAAVVSLAKILADAKAPYSAKVSAAQALLKFGRDGIEIEDLEVRVDELERTVAIQDGPGSDNSFASSARRITR